LTQVVPWEPLPQSSREPTSLSASLDRVRRHLGVATASELDVISAAWVDLVGPELAHRSRPVRCRSGVLEVEVDDASVGARMRYQTESLVALLADAEVAAGVKRIVVKVAPAGSSRAGRAMPPDGR